MIYFDNAASTKTSENVADAIREVLLNGYANPSSQSRLGLECAQMIRGAARKLAGYINASEDEIYFTSGGTESNSWALFGTAEGYARSGRHIISTTVEHPAVARPLDKLAERGYEITLLNVDEAGKVDINELKSSIRDDTILVSIILVNNETGTMQDAAAIGAAVKEANPRTLLHMDAVQAFGKFPIDVKRMNIDLLSASGHKLHGIKGTGLLYMKNGLKVKPFILGGGQQRGQRSGTENTAGAVSLAKAAEECFSNMAENAEAVGRVKETLVNGVMASIPDTILNGDGTYIANISFLGVRSEVLLHALEEKGIFVSAGSACSSRKKNLSHVLKAMGLDDDRAESAIRFSFSRYSDVAEAEECVKALAELTPMLRRVQRRAR